MCALDRAFQHSLGARIAINRCSQYAVRHVRAFGELGAKFGNAGGIEISRPQPLDFPTNLFWPERSEFVERVFCIQDLHDRARDFFHWDFLRESSRSAASAENLWC